MEVLLSVGQSEGGTFSLGGSPFQITLVLVELAETKQIKQGMFSRFLNPSILYLELELSHMPPY